MKPNLVLSILITALVAGGGVYLWQNSGDEEAILVENSEELSQEEPELVTSAVYEDSWLSFEFPEGVEVLVDGQGEGRPTRSLSFIYWDEDTMAYSPVGLVLEYPRDLEEDFATFTADYMESYDSEVTDLDEDVKTYWYYEELMVDGREAFLTSESGIGEPIKTLIITFDENSQEYSSSDVYKFQTAGMTAYNKELSDSILDLFIATAEFSK